MNVFGVVASWFAVPSVSAFRTDPGWPELVGLLVAEQVRREADAEERRAGIAWLEAFFDRRRTLDADVDARGGGPLSDAAHAVLSFTPGTELTVELVERLHGPGGLPLGDGSTVPLAVSPASQTHAGAPEPLSASEAI